MKISFPLALLSMTLLIHPSTSAQTVENGFRVLINGVECVKQSDIDGSKDNPYIKIYVDGAADPTIVLGPYDMQSSETTKANERYWLMPGAVLAKNRVLIELWEEDNLNADDFIGEFTITAATADDNFIKKEFRTASSGDWNLVCTKITRDQIDRSVTGKSAMIDVRVPILNQGQEGACVAFAVVGALTTRYLNDIKPGGSNKELFDPFALYARRGYTSEGWNIGSCLNEIMENGLPFKDGAQSLELHSFCKYYRDGRVEKTWVDPQSGNIQTAFVSQASTANAGLDKMRKEIKAGHPLIARYDVYDDFKGYTNTNGMYGGRVYDGSAQPSGHAVFVVGYENPPPQANGFPTWILQNSWGSKYGANGLCVFAQGACGFDEYMYKIGDYEIIGEASTNDEVPNEGPEYSVEIDACHTGLDHTGTGGTISVRFFDEDNRLVRTVSRNGVDHRCNSIDNETFSTRSPVAITRIEVSTNTEDAFFIDELMCYKDGKLRAHHGRDDGQGWCLSTDANDANGQWRNNIANGCRSKQSFDFNVKGDAKASTYKCTIDACHTDLDNTGTGNTIKVAFYAGSRKAGEVTRQGVGDGCLGADEAFEISSELNISHVIISTNGDDGFFIDELRLYKDGDLKIHHGGDNNSGWCLSTDPGDANGQWSGMVANGCLREQKFDYYGSSKPEPKPVKYEVRIDACHSDLDNTETGGTISVKFYAGSTHVGTKSIGAPGTSCLTADHSFELFSTSSITHVDVTTNSSDGFYIDELRLLADGNLKAHHGRDNGSGWCLSTDPNDANGAWKHHIANGCRSSQRFSYAEGSNPVNNPTYEYRVEIDACHGDLDNTGTGGRITVEFWAGSTKAGSQSANGVGTTCLTADEKFSLRTSHKITHVFVKTNSADGFFIDELRLYRANTLVKHHGRDNGGGWCLSTDPNDANGQWKNNLANGCRSSQRFNY